MAQVCDFQRLPARNSILRLLPDGRTAEFAPVQFVERLCTTAYDVRVEGESFGTIAVDADGENDLWSYAIDGRWSDWLESGAYALSKMIPGAWQC